MGFNPNIQELIRRKAPIRGHAVSAIVIETQENGIILCDRMTYTKNGQTTIRHMMETGELGENVKKTLEIGVPHELAEDALDFEFKLLFPNPILVELSPDKDEPEEIHLKVGYAIEIISGRLRTRILQDGDETLGPPTMVPINMLISETRGTTIPFHYRMTCSALGKFASERKVFDRYINEISAYQPPQLSRDELSIIDAYQGKW